MVFSSAPFMFIFLPVLFILYTLIPNLKLQNALLIVASLLFYGYGEPVFVFVMLASVLINYILAILLVKYRSHHKAIVAVAVIINLAMIGVFKYASFAVNNINALFSLHIPDPHITLPIGISFFTFQILSYVIDVDRDPRLLTKNFFDVLLYISFFPQLIAGPIVKYHDVQEYISERHQNVTEVAQGIRRFIVGLAKKLFLANTMGAVATSMFALKSADMSMATAWAGAITYTLQIYFDFSGYSDMAIGLGHMFGFTFLENFEHPYISTSIREFWRRWHISLSTWFKEYLYIPLGGNRRGKKRMYLNKLIVFFATGLWHGANWTFVIWGMIHGFALLIEDASGIRKFTDRHKWIGWLYTMLIVIFAFVLFNASSLSNGLAMMSHMVSFKAGNINAYNALVSVLTPYNIIFFVISLVAATPLLNVFKKIAVHNKAVRYGSYILTYGLFILCMLNIANASFNPFIYFQF